MVDLVNPVIAARVPTVYRHTYAPAPRQGKALAKRLNADAPLDAAAINILARSLGAALPAA